MFERMRHLVFKIRLHFGNSEKKSRLYRKYLGVSIGKNIRFTGKPSWGSEPYLVEIGDNVTITQNVSFQTHDGGVGIFRKEFPGINVFGKIKVGNNVFIGADSMIMYGVTIGDNVVIGARSVVTRDIPSNSLVVGSPARVIKTINEYKASSLKKAIYIKSSDYELRKIEIMKQLNEY